MKRTLMGAAVLAAAVQTSYADEVALPRDKAPIHDVTVYPDRALAARSARVTLPGPGEHDVVFARLPASIDDETIRVKGSAAWKLVGMRVEAVPTVEANDPRVRDLEAKIEVLRWQIAEQEHRRAVAENEKAFLEALRATTAQDASKGLGAGLASPEAWLKAVEFVNGRLEKVFESERAIDQAIEKARREAKVLEQERANLLSGASRMEKNVRVTVKADAAGPIDVGIAYVCRGAGWGPQYDLRGANDRDEVEVEYKGVVWQRTGEDWANVDLVLSTAAPSLGARPPNLDPWYIDLARGAPSGGVFGRAAARAPAAEAAKPAEKKTDEEAVREVAVAEHRGTSVAFAIGRKETVTSDGKPIRTTIAQRTFKCEKEYWTVPKLQAFAYLKALFKNEWEFPLLRGEAAVYYGPDYVGRAQVDPTAPGEEMVVFLGADQAIKVERKLEKKDRERKGLIWVDNKHTFEYLTTIQSFRKDKVKLVVLDQLPVSRDADLKVDVTEIAPPPTERDEKAGELRWQTDLAPAAKVTFAVRYTVTYPKGETPLGLE